MSAESMKARVRAFWDNEPCGTRTAGAEPGTPEFYRAVETHRYEQEFHIPDVAGFAAAAGKRVLEIGGGLGTDGRQFARRGARYIDLDLSSHSLHMARRGFRLENLPGAFLHGDAEQQPFASDTFDLIYSHGVLHHTPDTERAIGEVWRILKPGGVATIMLYARVSLGYAAAHVMGRGRLIATRREMGNEAFNDFIGLPRDHRGWLPWQVVINNSTDGLGNPLSKFYTARELRLLFGRFGRVRLQKHYVPRHKIPLVGPLLPKPVAYWLGRALGSYYYVEAVK